MSARTARGKYQFLCPVRRTVQSAVRFKPASDPHFPGGHSDTPKRKHRNHSTPRLSIPNKLSAPGHHRARQLHADRSQNQRNPAAALFLPCPRRQRLPQHLRRRKLHHQCSSSRRSPPILQPDLPSGSKKHRHLRSHIHNPTNKNFHPKHLILQIREHKNNFNPHPFKPPPDPSHRLTGCAQPASGFGIRHRGSVCWFYRHRISLAQLERKRPDFMDDI